MSVGAAALTRSDGVWPALQVTTAPADQRSLREQSIVSRSFDSQTRCLLVRPGPL
jgi:hypothetical protein